MPGVLSSENFSGQIDCEGTQELVIMSATPRRNDYGQFIEVVWENAEGQTFKDRIQTGGEYAWRLGNFLVGLGLAQSPGDPWDEAEWAGRHAHVTLRKNVKGYLRAWDYESLDGTPAATSPATPAQEITEEDPDIPF